jgi:hypothetical protein
LLDFLWIALGLGALLVAVCLCLVLIRLLRTLAALEEALRTADEAMRVIVPQVHGSLDNVNQITAGVNLGLNVAGTGAARLGGVASRLGGGAAWRAAALTHGVRVSLRSLARSYTERRLGPAGEEEAGVAREADLASTIGRDRGWVGQTGGGNDG